MLPSVVVSFFNAPCPQFLSLWVQLHQNCYIKTLYFCVSYSWYVVINWSGKCSHIEVNSIHTPIFISFLVLYNNHWKAAPACFFGHFVDGHCNPLVISKVGQQWNYYVNLHRSTSWGFHYWQTREFGYCLCHAVSHIQIPLSFKCKKLQNSPYKMINAFSLYLAWSLSDAYFPVLQFCMVRKWLS